MGVALADLPSSCSDRKQKEDCSVPLLADRTHEASAPFMAQRTHTHTPPAIAHSSPGSQALLPTHVLSSYLLYNFLWRSLKSKQA